MSSYPIQLEVSSPPKFERLQLLVRCAIAIALGVIGIEMGWVWGVLFLTLPVIAAVVVSARGADFYLAKTAPRVWTGLRWLLAFSAYMLLITDRIALGDGGVRADLHITGRPTVGTALARLLMSIPSAIALFFVGILAGVLWVISLLSILFSGTVPGSIIELQTGYLRWQARLAAYHASLVEEYPPYSLRDRSSDVPTAMVNP